MKVVRLFLVCVMVLGMAGCAKIDAVNTLLEVSRSEKLKAKAIAQQTKNFQRVKEGILAQEIVPGFPSAAILQKYGEPVLVYDEDPLLRWVYKAGDTSWFDGEKIYLYFDQATLLDHYECNAFECPALEKGVSQ